MNTRILAVKILVADRSGLNSLPCFASTVRIPPKTLMSSADQALQLNGTLLAYVAAHNGALDVVDVSNMGQAEWRAEAEKQVTLLVGRPYSQWKLWCADTDISTYGVLVVFESGEKVPTDMESPTEVKGWLRRLFGR